jgi:hypothetical protein
MKTIVTSAFVALGMVIQSHAAIVQFDLAGRAGFGLLTANEPGNLTGGTGGEIGKGITFDDVTRLLIVHVGWGSGNGFSNLTGNINNQHIHGPVSSINGNGFTETTGVQFNLSPTSTSSTSGSISNGIILTAAQATNLFQGKYYVNLHTVANSGGECRGFLIAVPHLTVTVTNTLSKLVVSNTLGQRHLLQVSTNGANWTSVLTNTSGSPFFEYSENNPAQFASRYYRALVILP